ncbi:MAG TPA: hypothetical protein VG518_07125, partial [Solirubrobacterales bacterium]|nr:hypothetical protein [Solirubrobacterales bacterium]
MAPWKLPVIVLGIVLPIVAAFAIGGAGVGVAVGALAAVGIVAIAARQRPRGAIVPAGPEDGRRHVLLVIGQPVESPETVSRIAMEAGVEGEGAATEL